VALEGERKAWVHLLHKNARGFPVEGLMISFTDANNSAEALHRHVGCREAKKQTPWTLDMACMTVGATVAAQQERKRDPRGPPDRRRVPITLMHSDPISSHRFTLPQGWECQPYLIKALSTGSMLSSIGRKDQRTTKEVQQGRGGQR